jgi:hypothetical protein
MVWLAIVGWIGADIARNKAIFLGWFPFELNSPPDGFDFEGTHVIGEHGATPG